MAWVTTDSIKGNKGDKGDPGSIASASAESVPASEPAAVIMTGTDAVKHAHFRVPRGLPGLDAVPSDEGVAAYIGAVETATRAALNGSFLNYLVWTGAMYPPRVDGAVNVFIGPVDPGLAMQGDDLWTNPDTTTMPEVVAAMFNPSSALYAATKATVATDTVRLPLLSTTNLAEAYGTASPAVIQATSLPKDGTTKAVNFSGRMPAEWRSAVMCFRWVHDSPAGTAARFSLGWSIADGSGVKGSQGSTTNFTSDGRMRPTTFRWGGGLTGNPGDLVSGGIARISGNAGDTITGSVGIMDVWMERTS